MMNMPTTILLITLTGLGPVAHADEARPDTVRTAIQQSLATIAPQTARQAAEITNEVISRAAAEVDEPAAPRVTSTEQLLAQRLFSAERS